MNDTEANAAVERTNDENSVLQVRSGPPADNRPGVLRALGALTLSPGAVLGPCMHSSAMPSLWRWSRRPTTGTTSRDATPAVASSGS